MKNTRTYRSGSCKCGRNRSYRCGRNRNCRCGKNGGFQASRCLLQPQAPQEYLWSKEQTCKMIKDCIGKLYKKGKEDDNNKGGDGREGLTGTRDTYLWPQSCAYHYPPHQNQRPSSSWQTHPQNPRGPPWIPQQKTNMPQAHKWQSWKWRREWPSG